MRFNISGLFALLLLFVFMFSISYAEPEPSFSDVFSTTFLKEENKTVDEWMKTAEEKGAFAAVVLLDTLIHYGLSGQQDTLNKINSVGMEAILSGEIYADNDSLMANATLYGEKEYLRLQYAPILNSVFVIIYPNVKTPGENPEKVDITSFYTKYLEYYTAINQLAGK